MKFLRVKTYSIQLKHIVCGVGVGVRNVINSLFVCFSSITEKSFMRVLRFSCKKKKKTYSIFTRKPKNTSELFLRNR